MGIFGKVPSGSDATNESVSSTTSTRNRRNSSNSVSNSVSNAVPVSIVPAPPQGGQIGVLMKSGVPGCISSGSSVFGRQQSWSDQLADSALLKGPNSTKISVISGYPPGLHYSNNSNTGNDVKFVHSTMEILENQIKREEAPKKKRTRTSTEQLRILQKAFQTDPMPNSSSRAALSKKLGMSTRAVQVWFQNRRAKEKLDAKRNALGLSGTSSFTYVKSGSGSDDEIGNEDEDEFNFDDEDSVETPINPVTIKANGLMGRMAFNPTSSGNLSNCEVPIKAQRSSSTPNGFFQGNFPSISSQQGRFNAMNLNSKTCNYFSSNNPLCHLFPGETFISDVNEASVDQLYQDLGGASGSAIPSPIDDTCAVNFSGQGTGSNFTSSSSSASAAAANFFTFGDPFYGGGIVDRTPSVSPVGFGPRSHFFHPIGGAANFDFMLPNPLVANEFNALETFPTNTNNACKGISAGNVYLTSSISTNTHNNNTNINNSANRRSFSLPEAHGNLTFQQVQQLENFGLQVFPSPLLSINEEEPCKNTSNTNNHKDNSENITNNNITSNTGNTNSSDFLIPFSDFLEGEVIR